MTRFTNRMEAQLLDFLSEVRNYGIVPDEGLDACEEMVTFQKNLYQDVDAWESWRPDFLEPLRATWIEQAINEVMSRGPEEAQEFLESRCDQEDYGHSLKTDERMALLIGVSGLARILFSSFARYSWIHPIYKAFLWVLAAPEREAEFPHLTSFDLPTRVGVRTISLFVHE